MQPNWETPKMFRSCTWIILVTKIEHSWGPHYTFEKFTTICPGCLGLDKALWVLALELLAQFRFELSLRMVRLCILASVANLPSSCFVKYILTRDDDPPGSIRTSSPNLRSNLLQLKMNRKDNLHEFIK